MPSWKGATRPPGQLVWYRAGAAGQYSQNTKSLAPHSAVQRYRDPHLAWLQMGSYHIGKERAYLGAAHQLGWRVHCPPAKRKVGLHLR